MPTWPTYAKLRRAPVTEDHATALQRTDMEGGLPKQAKVMSRVLVGRELDYTLASNTDYQAWVTWFRHTIGYGAAWFDWRDPVTQQIVQARIRNGKFAATCSDLVQGDPWVLRLTIETWSG